MAHSSIMRLRQAVDGFLEDVPKGTPPEVLKGLQNLSEGLRGAPEGPESPGQKAVAAVGGDSERRKLELDSDELTPGQREARALSGDE